jgi:hypothetical protein
MREQWRRLTLAVALLMSVASCAAANSLGVSKATRGPAPGVSGLHPLVNHLLDLADVADARGDRPAADRFQHDADELECRVFRCPAPVGRVTVAMDPTTSGGFMSMPWPADTRRNADGTIDLTGFPGRANPLVDLVLGNGSAVTHGFGTNAAVYMQTTGPLDPATLPTADQSVGERATTMLLDLNNPEAAPVPLLSNYKPTSTPLRPGNLIALLPYPGHPLTPGHRYAAVAFNRLLDTRGLRLAPSPLLKQLNGPSPAGVPAATWNELRAERDATIHAVRTRTEWHPRDVVAFTVFTTQQITPELQAIAAAIRSLPSPAPVSRASGSCSPGVSQASIYGTLDLPKWQAGTSPYTLDGGQIVVGSDGHAIQQSTERAVFQMAWPCAPAPARGWPILLFMDGTGAGPNATFISQLDEPQHPLPYLVLSIAPLYSGDRFVPNPVLPGDLNFFNFVNPLAGRTNQLQQAADMLYLKRVAQGIKLAPSEAFGGVAPNTDNRTVVIAGHSQGAVTLPLTLAADPTIRAAFESSGGAGLYDSIVHRGDVREFLAPFVPTLPGELDKFLPAVQAVQTIGEIGDAANYAPLVRTADVAVYAGWVDGCTTIESTIHLANALGIQVANPIGGPVFGSARFEPSVVALPVSKNLRHRRTGVMVEVNDGHFGASFNPSIGRSFVDSIAKGGPATVDPGPLGSNPPSPPCLRAPDPPLGG